MLAKENNQHWQSFNSGQIQKWEGKREERGLTELVVVRNRRSHGCSSVGALKLTADPISWSSGLHRNWCQFVLLGLLWVSDWLPFHWRLLPFADAVTEAAGFVVELIVGARVGWKHSRSLGFIKKYRVCLV